MQPFDLTGNDYVSIPCIGQDGSVEGVNVLHSGLAGLIEWTGSDAEPLLSLEISVDGVPVSFDGARWRRLDRWIPAFTVTLADGSPLTGTFCAPGGYPAARGFLLHLELENRGRRPVDVTTVLKLAWLHTQLRIATARPFGTDNHLSLDGDVLLLRTDGGRGPALAFACTAAATMQLEPTHGSDAHAPNGTVLRARIEQRFTVTPQRRGAVAFFAGAGREPDGAAASARALRRTGADQWLRQARLELSHMVRAAQDHRWAETLNRNLLFNRYYAVARGIDDDRLHLLRSRSPRAQQPVLFNEREALFWTLPALLLSDPGLAREALLRILELFSERSGEYLRYVDGAAFDPAFVLEQCLLHAWAVGYCVDQLRDDALLDEPLVQQVLFETDMAVFMRLDSEHMLAASDLLPSGDVADFPYTTMGNVLLWHFCDRLPRLSPPPPHQANDAADPAVGHAHRFAGAASEVAAAIWQHCTTDVGGELVFASSADLNGAAAVYDDPAFSLVLLPFFGFCSADDPVWRTTLEYLRSPRYPLWRAGQAAGVAHRSDPARTRLAALCSDLLGPDAADALDRLQRITLPNGVAAGACDPATGEGSEPHDAALAGFLCWSLAHAAEPKVRTGAAKKRRR